MFHFFSGPGEKLSPYNFHTFLTPHGRIFGLPLLPHTFPDIAGSFSIVPTSKIAHHLSVHMTTQFPIEDHGEAKFTISILRYPLCEKPTPVTKEIDLQTYKVASVECVFDASLKAQDQDRNITWQYSVSKSDCGVLLNQGDRLICLIQHSNLQLDSWTANVTFN